MKRTKKAIEDLDIICLEEDYLYNEHSIIKCDEDLYLVPGYDTTTGDENDYDSNISKIDFHDFKVHSGDVLSITPYFYEGHDFLLTNCDSDIRMETFFNVYDDENYDKKDLVNEVASMINSITGLEDVIVCFNDWKSLEEVEYIVGISQCCELNSNPDKLFSYTYDGLTWEYVE